MPYKRESSVGNSIVFQEFSTSYQHYRPTDNIDDSQVDSSNDFEESQQGSPVEEQEFYGVCLTPNTEMLCSCVHANCNGTI